MAALSTALLVGATAVGAAGQIAGGIGARRMAGDITAEGARLAADALARGEEEATRYRQDLAQLLGRQRTALAASNVDVTRGSAADVREQTEIFGEEDVATIRRNAEREAYAIRQGAEAQAGGLRGQALGAFISGGSTLLTLGVDQWQRYQAGRTPSRGAPRPLMGRGTNRPGALPTNPYMGPG